MIKQRESNSWKSVSYAKSITGTQTYTKIPIVLRTTQQSIPTWSVKGNMQQNGTPTPSSPITPSECGERTENLLDYSTFVNDYWLNNTTGLPQPYNNGGRIATTSPINVSNVNNVTFNFTSEVANTQFMYSLFNGSTLIERVTGLPRGTTIDVSNGDTLYLCLYRNTSLPITISDVSDAMLNVGSTAKPYEPYGYKLPIVSGNTTTNIYLSEPLRKIGDYADTIAADDTVTRNIDKVVLTGQETAWVSVNSGTENQYFSLPVSAAIQGNELCTHFVKNDIYNGNTNVGVMVVNAGSIRIRTENVSSMSLTDFTTFLQQQYTNGTPVTIWYVLETPITETVTMPSIPTTSGLNTIDVASALKPSEMSISYDGYKLCKGQRYSRTENLFDGNLEQGSFNADGSETTWSDITYRVRSTFFGELSSGTYTINCSGADDVVVNVYETSDTSTFKSDESLTSWDSLPRTFTLTANRYVRFAFRKSDNSDIAPSEISNLMLNTGSTAKPYQPYLDWK